MIVVTRYLFSDTWDCDSPILISDQSPIRGEPSRRESRVRGFLEHRTYEYILVRLLVRARSSSVSATASSRSRCWSSAAAYPTRPTSPPPSNARCVRVAAYDLLSLCTQLECSRQRPTPHVTSALPTSQRTHCLISAALIVHIYASACSLFSSSHEFLVSLMNLSI